MNRLNDIQRARLLELAVERATGGLSRDELRELEILVGPDAQRLDDSMERAAAAIHLSSLPPVEPMPRELAARVATDADRFFAPQRQASIAVERSRTSASLPSWFSWAGWVAAAASFVAIIALLSLDKAAYRDDPQSLQAQESAQPDGTGLDAAPLPASEVARMAGRREVPTIRSGQAEDADAQSAVSSASEQRLALLRNQRFLLRRNWAAAGDSTGIGVQGDVIWDARTQQGFMRFTGLRRNDPSQEQYQLWIFDGQRDQHYPVDGGVFDSDGEDELVVPIQARLAVATPLAFAITIEQPGGVVVSDRRRVVVIARIT